MSNSGGRSILASIVGWLIVAIIVWLFFGGVLGAIRLLARMFFFVVVIGVLLTLYFRLRDSD